MVLLSSQTVTSQIGTADAFQKVSSDPQITQSFQDAMTSLCYEIPVCDFQDPYRTADGSCNNLFNPLLGKSFTPQSRVIPNAYRNCKFYKYFCVINFFFNKLKFSWWNACNFGWFIDWLKSICSCRQYFSHLLAVSNDLKKNSGVKLYSKSEKRLGRKE